MHASYLQVRVQFCRPTEGALLSAERATNDTANDTAANDAGCGTQQFVFATELIADNATGDRAANNAHIAARHEGFGAADAARRGFPVNHIASNSADHATADCANRRAEQLVLSAEFVADDTAGDRATHDADVTSGQ